MADEDKLITSKQAVSLVKKMVDGAVQKKTFEPDLTPYPTKTEVSTEVDQVLLRAYPVGSIYFSSKDVSPASLFGGTWEQLKDSRYLRLGSSYTTGGSNSWSGSHNHTQAAHSHTVNAHVHTGGAHTHTLNSHTHTSAAHSHPLGSTGYAMLDIGQGSNYYMFPRFITVSAYSANYQAGIYSGVSSATSSRTWALQLGGTTSSQTPGATGGPSNNNTSSAGAVNTGEATPGTNSQTPTINNTSLTVTIEPEYQQVYAWIRTA